jgi:3-oxoacyl-[acyl-carrier protein] reductase
VKEELEERYGSSVLAATGDVSSGEDVERVVQESIEMFGKVDALVNSAGIIQTARFSDLTWEDWTRMLSVHLDGSFLTMRAVIPHMLASKYGCIVNIASTAGMTGGTSGAHYAAAKGGVIALTRAVAKEVASEGIRVNCVAPSKIETDMLQGAREDVVETIPIRRLGRPEEVADAVAFLLSDKASYIVGEVIVVAGGYR